MKKTEQQMIAEMHMMLEYLTDCLDENGVNQDAPRLYDDLKSLHNKLNMITCFDDIIESDDWKTKELNNLTTMIEHMENNHAPVGALQKTRILRRKLVRFVGSKIQWSQLTAKVLGAR